MIGKIYFTVLCVLLLVPSLCIADQYDESKCQKKTISTHAIIGKFDEFMCGDFCYGTVKDDKGEYHSFTMGEEAAESLGLGSQVSIVYVVEQDWNPFAGECMKSETYVSGNVISLPAPTLAGTYKYDDSGDGEGQGGEMTITQNSEGIYIDVNVYNTTTFGTCGWTGVCFKIGYTLVCPRNEEDISEDIYAVDLVAVINPNTNEIDVVSHQRTDCGRDSSIYGTRWTK